jgi:hypothetical protein
MQSKLASIDAAVVAELTENWPYLWKLQIHKAVACIAVGVVGGVVLGFAAGRQPEDIRQWLLLGHLLVQGLLVVWWFWSSYNVFRIGNLALDRRTPHFLVIVPIGLAILTGGVVSISYLAPSFLDGMQKSFILSIFLHKDVSAHLPRDTIDTSWVILGEAWFFLLLIRISALGGHEGNDRASSHRLLAVPVGLSALCAVVVWLWGVYWGAYLAVIATIFSTAYVGACWFSGRRLWHGYGFVIALIVLPQFAAGLALATTMSTPHSHIITLSVLFGLALWTDLISYLVVQVLMLPER